MLILQIWLIKLSDSKEMGFFMKLEEKLLEQYFDVIEKKSNTENQI